MKKTCALILALLLVCALVNTGLAYTDIMTPGGELPIVTSDYHLVIGTPAIATVTDYDNNHLTEYLRERSGIDIEVYLFDAQEYKQQLQLMTSANEKLPDTIWAFSLNAIERESYGRQGYFIPLNDFFEDSHHQGVISPFYSFSLVPYKPLSHNNHANIVFHYRSVH